MTTLLKWVILAILAFSFVWYTTEQIGDCPFVVCDQGTPRHGWPFQDGGE